MLNCRQRKAVRLLFEMPDDKVAEEVGVRPETLRRWKGKKEFIRAMRIVAREVREAAGRIVSHCLAYAASRLCGTLTVDAKEPAAKPDPKVLVDMLKGSGLLAASSRGPEDEDLMAEFADDEEAVEGV